MADESSSPSSLVVVSVADTKASLAAEQTIDGDECDLLIGSRGDDDDNEMANINRCQESQSNESSFISKLFSFIKSNHQSNSKHQRSNNYQHHDYHDQFSHSKPENWLFDSDEVVHYSRTGAGELKYNSYQDAGFSEIAAKSSLGHRSSHGILSSLGSTLVQQPITTIKHRRLPLNLLLSLLTFLCLFASIGLIIRLNDLIREQKQKLDLNIAYNAPKFEQELSQHVASRWLVSSSKCHIPIIDPWHRSIENYVEVKKPLNCTRVLGESNSKLGPALTYVHDNRLYFNKNVSRLRNNRHRHRQSHAKDIFDIKHPKCCYKEVTRGEENDDGVLVNKTCIEIFKNGLEAPFSVIRVECREFNYTNVHTFTIDDSEEELALSRISKRKLNNMKHYNIVMVGVDTMSRLNGKRQLGKTLKVLENQYKTLEFSGYNKVGENTFPNLIPLLTGLKPEQLTETTCWLASNYSQETERGDDFLDNCKYLWNYYQEIGYTTYFSEDWPAASTFNYLKQGFRKEPTSFYGRPFTLARDKLLLPTGKCASCLLDEPVVQIDLENLKTFLRVHEYKPHFAFHWINCPQHDDLNGASQIDYILEKFFLDIHELTQQGRTFVIFHSDHGYRWNNFVSTRIGHYESSLPMLTIAPPREFIKDHPKLYENMKKHQSVLLTPFDMFKTLVGIRNLSMKNNNQAPNSQLRANNGDNDSVVTKSNNVKVSITKADSFDRDEKREAGNSNDISEIGSTPSSSSISTTTFKQLMPMDGLHYEQKFMTISLLDEHNQTELDRSCIEAGIPDNYCVCHEFEKTDVGSDDVLGASYYYVYVYLYNRIKDQISICSPLDLELVHEAEIFDFKRMKVEKGKGKRRRKRDRIDEDGNPDDDGNSDFTTTTPRPDSSSNRMLDELQIDESHYLPNREYNVRISTLPGKGLFQEVVRFYGDDLKACQLAVKQVTLQMIGHSSSGAISHETKHDSVMNMNKVCRFSIHSDSISRLNLYKDQSKCVKSNSELKKICYCK